MSSTLPSVNRNNYNAPFLEEPISQEPLHKSESSSPWVAALPKGTPSQKSQLGSSLNPRVPLFSNSNDLSSEITSIDHKVVPVKTSPYVVGKLPSLTSKTEGFTEEEAVKYHSSEPTSISLPKKADSDADSYAIFSITNSDILKIIDPTIHTSNEKQHAGKKARAKLDQCIELDPTILDSSGRELKDKVRNALAQLRRAKPSSLPPDDSLKPVDFSAFPSKSENISSETRDHSWDSFSKNRDDLKTINPDLDFSKKYSSIRRSLKKARAKLNKCIDIDPTIISEPHGPIRRDKIRNAMEILTQAKPSSSFSLPPIKT